MTKKENKIKINSKIEKVKKMKKMKKNQRKEKNIFSYRDFIKAKLRVDSKIGPFKIRSLKVLQKQQK